MNNRELLGNYGFWSFHTYIIPYFLVVGILFNILFKCIDKVGNSILKGPEGLFLLLIISAISISVSFIMKDKNKIIILERMKNE
jgi:hypothetical protein